MRSIITQNNEHEGKNNFNDIEDHRNYGDNFELTKNMLRNDKNYNESTLQNREQKGKKDSK